MKKILFLAISQLLLASCTELAKPKDSTISKSEMLEIVKKYGHKFSIGVKQKDTLLLSQIYSDSAQYVMPKRPILDGRAEIAKDWGSFLRLKEKPVDLILQIHDVRGTREILYETGHGYTLLADSSKWEFNYVNVWRLQKDGSYKLEVDTYN
jgi:ketosteroid isomerase-like protein